MRSTRRYARMADGALLEVLRPPRGADGRGARKRRKFPRETEELVVEAAGIEPDAEPPNAPKDNDSED